MKIDNSIAALIVLLFIAAAFYINLYFLSDKPKIKDMIFGKKPLLTSVISCIALLIVDWNSDSTFSNIVCIILSSFVHVSLYIYAFYSGHDKGYKDAIKFVTKAIKDITANTKKIEVVINNFNETNVLSNDSIDELITIVEQNLHSKYINEELIALADKAITEENKEKINELFVYLK